MQFSFDVIVSFVTGYDGLYPDLSNEMNGDVEPSAPPDHSQPPSYGESRKKCSKLMRIILSKNN